MAKRKVRLSHQGLRVLGQFLERPKETFAGSDLAKSLNIGSGTLYPLLQRFEEVSWLASEWEEIEPSEESRPRKRLYRITPLGQNEARAAFGELGQIRGESAWNT